MDVRPIVSAIGAANYLGKYLTKTYGTDNKMRAQLEARGFLRRFSKSNNWPGDFLMRREGTVEKSWVLRGYRKGHVGTVRQVAESQNVPEARQFGNDVQLFLVAHKKVLRGIKKIDNYIDGSIHAT